MKKTKSFFRFSILKNFLVLVIRGQIFSKQLKDMEKNIFQGQIGMIVEKFGVHRPIPQSTADDDYRSSRYRTIFSKRLTKCLVFKVVLKGQEFKISPFFQGLRSFRGSQKSEKLNFSKPKNSNILQ